MLSVYTGTSDNKFYKIRVDIDWFNVYNIAKEKTNERTLRYVSSPFR